MDRWEFSSSKVLWKEKNLMVHKPIQIKQAFKLTRILIKNRNKKGKLSATKWKQEDFQQVPQELK